MAEELQCFYTCMCLIHRGFKIIAIFESCKWYKQFKENIKIALKHWNWLSYYSYHKYIAIAIITSESQF